jgi:hypothetical protein
MTIKQEIAVFAVNLSKSMMDSNCTDIDTLTLVDKLMRRSLPDIHPGWVRWSYYVESQIFKGNVEKYEEWAEQNSARLKNTP